MSAKYTFLAWDTPIENAPLKLALLQLANNADDDGFSYYSISKMATACGMSERTFMRKIAELEKKGILTVERRSNRPSLYTLIGDEMGVTLCHLQSTEVTECHAEVTECHLVGDSVSHDPNSTPNNTPDISDRLDYKKIQSIYNSTMTKLSNMAKMTDKRKKETKKFFTDFDFNLEKLENYLHHINTDPDCRWLIEKRPKNDGSGQNWKAKGYDYFLSEKCYLDIKEGMSNE